MARFALAGPTSRPGSVVLVDEFSQLPTPKPTRPLGRRGLRGCDGVDGRIPSRPSRSPPVVWPSGSPSEARDGKIPVAELTVNRRQTDPIERQAFTRFRDGRIVESQELRDDAGWEHHFANRDTALEAMAAAVLADIEVYGPDRVAALAVSHTDCEALGDRIRADLTDQGRIAGPTLEGPGWFGPRHYQAGDRILLHAHADPRRRQPPDQRHRGHRHRSNHWRAHRDHPWSLRAGHVASRVCDRQRKRRTAPVSHAWARTIDGVQGGTWDQVHLLATPALDRYRGYVGQSRSIQPTHTWNTTPRPSDDPGDHGGRLVEPYSTPAEQIAAALARAQPKTFAAVDDPYRYERQIRAEQATRRISTGPPTHRDLHRAEQVVRARQRDLETPGSSGPLAGTTAGDRWATRPDPPAAPRHHAARQSSSSRGRRARTTDVDAARREHQHLLDQQAEGSAFDQTNQWRHERIDALDRQLNGYWAEAVLTAAQDGYPAAYGIGRLEAARRTILAQVEALATRPAGSQQEPSPPPSRTPYEPWPT